MAYFVIIEDGHHKFIEVVGDLWRYVSEHHLRPMDPMIKAAMPVQKSGFIEVTTRHAGKILVNTDYIISIEKYRFDFFSEGKLPLETIIITSELVGNENRQICVEETFEQVKQMINDN